MGTTSSILKPAFAARDVTKLTSRNPHWLFRSLSDLSKAALLALVWAPLRMKGP